MSLPPHDSPAATNLRFEGLTVGFPVKQYARPRRWRSTFRATRRMARWDQKALAMKYLYQEYEACDFEFFKPKDGAENVFVVEYTTFAL